MSDTPRCTRCDATEAVPIIWGIPSPELVEEIASGKVDAIIGGCCVVPPTPTHECGRCGARFAEGEAWYQPPATSAFFADDGMSDEELTALAERIRDDVKRRTS